MSLRLNHLCYAPRDPEPEVSRSLEAIKERIEDGYSVIHSSDHYRVMLKDLKVLIKKISLPSGLEARNQNEANDGK